MKASAGCPCDATSGTSFRILMDAPIWTQASPLHAMTWLNTMWTSCSRHAGEGLGSAPRSVERAASNALVTRGIVPKCQSAMYILCNGSRLRYVCSRIYDSELSSLDNQQEQPSPAQIRAGRALLNWSQQQLAERSGVGRRTVAAYESGGERVMAANILGMKKALESAGIRFSPNDAPEGVHRISDR
jgi:DNA-binding XRE family transcriptional regulator